MNELITQLETARDQVKAELAGKGGRDVNLQNAIARLEQALASLRRYVG